MGKAVQQGSGVGVLGFAQNTIRRALLDHSARIHHMNPLAALLHHADVMADEEYGSPLLTRQGQQQVKDLAADAEVQGGGGFVGHDERGSTKEGHRNQNPLAHAATELMRPCIKNGLRICDTDV
jgi:hypothetical protein